jgi:hypothetical protein
LSATCLFRQRDFPFEFACVLDAQPPLAAPRLLGRKIETTTVLLNAGDRLFVNGLGWLDIELPQGSNEALKMKGTSDENTARSTGPIFPLPALNVVV